jgi:transcription antitermination factor NusG
MTIRWYIVHAYSNFEKKVSESIREQAKQRGLEDLFEQVLVPTEKVTEVRRGRKVDAERKFFPGYVLVKMNLTDEAFHLIKNTPKVTGFLGADNKPMPITETEAQHILQQVQEGEDPLLVRGPGYHSRLDGSEPPVCQRARANSWAAAAYLARAYVYQEKWQEAKALYDEIIPNGVTSQGVPYVLSDSFLV